MNCYDPLQDNEIDVVLSAHFIKQLYGRQSDFPKAKFFKHLPKLIEAGKMYQADDCMAIIGGAKIIFRLTKTQSGRKKLIIKTVMPQHFKHNKCISALTRQLGKINGLEL